LKGVPFDVAMRVLDDVVPPVACGHVRYGDEKVAREDHGIGTEMLTAHYVEEDRKIEAQGGHGVIDLDHGCYRGIFGENDRG
jgi:hypothetical protein